jgi:hypothetical protein
VELLLTHGADPVRALRSAADGGQARLMLWLLKKDPNLHTRL